VLTDEKLYNLTVDTKGVEKVKLRGYGKVESLKITTPNSAVFSFRGKVAFKWDP